MNSIPFLLYPLKLLNSLYYKKHKSHQLKYVGVYYKPLLFMFLVLLGFWFLVNMKLNLNADIKSLRQ